MMNEFHRIVKTFFAYLKHPELYPELIRKIHKIILKRKQATLGQEKAKEWAHSKAVDHEFFFKKNFPNLHFQSFDNLFKKDMEMARSAQEQCPIQMGGAGNLEILYYLAEACKAEKILETGVAYGWSSLALLKSLEKRNGTLYSSDMPYLAQNGDQYVGCVVPESLKKNWKLFRFADRESIPKILNECAHFDLIHYDSDKSYEGMKWAYALLYPLINTGGYFISDDIGDNAAFMDFCIENNFHPEIIQFEDKYIGILNKS